MTTQELAAKTVIELRKLAKENGVTLGAGISKEGIINKLMAALGDAEPAAPVAPAAPAEPVAAPQPVQAQPAPAQPQFKAAWHNPSPRYNSKPAYQAPAYPQRPSWQSGARPQGNEVQRQTPVRPANFTPRFGPGAADVNDQPQRQDDDYRTHRAEPRPAYGNAQRNYGDAPAYDAPRSYDQPQRNYDQPRWNNDQPTYGGYDGGYNRPQYNNRPAYQQPRREPYAAPEAVPAPSAAELMTAGECQDGSGILELHPDGYGFLRSEQFLPSSKDIYVSMAQIRRFQLRTGDRVTGKTRPQRDGDKYAAMLYITEVNGMPADDLPARPLFDELTPIYPTRRIHLEAGPDAAMNDMRLTDLIAPLGFGQRGLLLCPPETGKTTLLQHFANVIAANHPEVTVMVLLIDENPEDVTLFREQVTCPVLASTFDQAPENHLRLADLVLERSARLVEQGQDVVLLVDSLTRLAKVYTTAAAQQGRSMPGMVNPTSLLKAKKLFGAARCLKEGGSLTVIGAMNVETGSKVDDSVVEEFKGTANMELRLDAALAQSGVTPPINLQLSGTKRAEALLDAAHLEGLQLVRNMLSTTRSAVAIPQLLSLMDRAETNDALLTKIKDWVALMSKSR